MRFLLGWIFVVCLCTAQTNEDAVGVHLERARQAQQRRDFKTAVQEWQVLVRLLPNVAEAYSNLGMMWHFDRQYPNAIKAFGQAIALKPTLVGPHLFLGIDYYLISRPTEATVELSKALELDSRNPMAEKWLGMAYVQLGNCEKAIGFLTAARELNPTDADLSFSLSRAYTKLLFQSYNTIRSHDRNSPFLKAFRGGARSALPESSDPALAHVQSRIESGHASEEFVRLSHLVRTTSQNMEYWYWFGKCSEALARQYLEDFLSRSPDSYRIHQLKAEYFLAVNEEGQAINEYRKALSIKPDAIQLHADLGNLYMVHHEYQRAIEEYQAELRVNPYSLQSLERLGQAYADVHETEKAIEYLRRAIAINPHSFEALRAMGQVHYQRAEYQQAIFRFRSALAVRPENDSTILYHLVQTYKKLGNKTEAKKWSNELQRQLSKDLTRAQQNVNAAASPSVNQ